MRQTKLQVEWEEIPEVDTTAEEEVEYEDDDFD